MVQTAKIPSIVSRRKDAASSNIQNVVVSALVQQEVLFMLFAA
jgi:hypothetical protein